MFAIMDNSNLVLGLLETILGDSKGSKTTMDYSFHCPFCNHHKPKLVVNIKTGQYNCWTCNPATKGGNPVSLLKKLGCDSLKIKEMQTYFPDSRSKVVIAPEVNVMALPDEFESLNNTNGSLAYRHANAYAKSRGLTEKDILKYNIGYCSKGRYRNRLVVPSYDSDGKVNYFVARSYDPDSNYKIDAPTCNKTDIIGFEYYINWQVPVILCEGVFDAMAIKRNAIPLFGKTIPKALMLKLVESEVKTVYLALDRDAIKDSIQHSQKLLDIGKDVYLIDLEGKDPSDLGFDNMMTLLHKAKPLTFMDIFTQKMQLA